MAHLLAFAGACLWMLSIAIVVQRQRVLTRRLARLERAAGVRARRPPSRRRPASRTLPTVHQLAAMARPLQRAGG